MKKKVVLGLLTAVIAAAAAIAGYFYHSNAVEVAAVAEGITLYQGDVPPESRKIADIVRWIPFTPRQSHIDQLKYGLNIKDLSQLLVPYDWSCDTSAVRPSTLPVSVTADSMEGGLVKTGRWKIEFSNEPLRLNNAARYLFTITAAGRGEVQLGYYGYNRLGWNYLGRRVRVIPVTAVMKDYTVAIDPLAGIKGQGVEHLRFALAVRGEVKIRSAAIYAVPEYVGASTVEGEIKAVSRLPDPQKSDYEDCNYTAEFHVDNIRSGAPLPQKLQLVIPGFIKRQKTAYADWQPGAKTRLRLVLFDKLADKEKSVQLADDLQNFELENYYVRQAVPVSAYCTNDTGINFSAIAEYRSPFDNSVNPPISPAAAAAKNKYIAEDLAHINRRLAQLEAKEKELAAKNTSLNQLFNAIWEKRQKEFTLITYLKHQYVWARIGNSFFALPEKYTFIDRNVKLSDSNLAAITALSELLAANGVQLIVQIVPDFQALAARILNPEFRDLVDYQTAVICRKLGENGIEAVFASDELAKRALDYEFMFFYPSDYHPHDGAHDVITDLLQTRLQRFAADFADKSLQSELFSELKVNECLHPYDRLPTGCDIGNYHPGDVIFFKRFRYHGAPLVSDTQSRLFFFGNSFSRTPGSVEEPSFHGWLSRKLQYPLHTFIVPCSGPQQLISLEIFKNPQKFLQGKKAAVMLVGAVHLLPPHEEFVNLRQLDAQQKSLLNK